MLTILQQVHDEDHFGIILFDSYIEIWKESLIQATEENINAAMDYIRTIATRGG